MNFASPGFWAWLAGCLLASRLVLIVVRRCCPAAEESAAKLCLLATALCLLAVESPLTLAVFLWVVGAGWLAVSTGRTRAPAFMLLLLLQAAPLAYYKYWGFLLNDVLGLGVRVPSVLIPMGLSFYTFQTLGFWIDSRKAGAARPGWLDYLNFCSFFPQIVAGPIERRADLLPQIQATRFRLRRDWLDEAVPWIVLGLAYKLVVADNVAVLAAAMKVDASSAWQVWFECLLFALRIYFDFAGYSFVALGLGLLFGVRLTLNFAMPYWSADLRGFWRTWHVTLGGWLRDYIYRPLGGRGSPRWPARVLLVFLVSGLWHGAGWGFLAWGLAHGLGVVLCGSGRPWPLPGWVKWAATMAFVTATWLFFFERDPLLLREKALALVSPSAYSPVGLRSLPGIFASRSELLLAGVIAGLALAALLLEGLGKRRELPPYRLLRHPVATAVLVVLAVLLAATEESPFIYFNF
jgi:D-alanyl-lipoteichoic acid acyltransferase DltB (MBOAT superfamily)